MVGAKSRWGAEWRGVRASAFVLGGVSGLPACLKLVGNRGCGRMQYGVTDSKSRGARDEQSIPNRDRRGGDYGGRACAPLAAEAVRMLSTGFPRRPAAWGSHPLQSASRRNANSAGARLPSWRQEPGACCTRPSCRMYSWSRYSQFHVLSPRRFRSGSRGRVPVRRCRA